MTPQEEELIKQYEEQIAAYEKLLDETVAEPKGVAKIIAGPFEDLREGAGKGKIYYRASKGSDTVILYVGEEPLFGVDPIPPLLEQGTEVIIIGQTIVCVIPEELKELIEVPTFDLIGWDEIGGLKSQLHDIREAVEMPMSNATLAKDLGVQPIAGLLLYGPPGTGKTLIAKAIASTVLGAKTADAAAFQYMKGGEMLSKYVGEAENNIKKAFHSCREYTRKTGNKAVMFIDEAEALLPTRGSRKSSDVETTIVPTFLSEMSGFEGDNPIVILATNHKNAIDSAILREGRIDIKIEIKRPTEADTLDIFEIHLKKLKTHDSISDLSAMATELLFQLPAGKNISGAMIEAVSKDAIRKTMSRLIANPKSKEKGITLTDMAEAITSVNLSYAKAG